MGGLREMQGARSTGTLIECLSPLEDGTEEERERERERERESTIYSQKEFQRGIKNVIRKILYI